MTKISRGIFALRSAKNILNQKSLKLLYFALVHCYLIYGIQVWACAPNYILKGLFKKPKIAKRIISQAKYNAHNEPLFRTLAILPLPSLILYFQLQFMQQFQQKFLPDIFSETWIHNSVREIGENAIVLCNNGPASSHICSHFIGWKTAAYIISDNLGKLSWRKHLVH